ncbi:MAG: RNA polymerase sigma factor [Microthrixaceae bacterium]
MKRPPDEGRRRSQKLTDDELAAAAAQGDTAATEELLRGHARRIHATCRRLCRDRGDAEDAAQEAMISVVRGLPRFDQRSSVSSWIYRITTNACMDELRRRRRRPEPDDAVEQTRAQGVRSNPHPDPLEAALTAEQRHELLDALADLPEDYRVAVVLRDVADLDYATIAEVAGVPVGTIRSRIARGRGRLARMLDENGELSDPRPTTGTNLADATSKGGSDDERPR